MNTSPVSYKRHRFPPQIIAHTVWLYFRFPLSLRLVEELLLERGIAISYETIRRCGKKFGPDYAPSPSPQEAQRKRCVASGRGRHHNCRQETLAMAGRRSKRVCA